MQLNIDSTPRFFKFSSVTRPAERLSGVAYSDKELVIDTQGLQEFKRNGGIFSRGRFRNGRFSACIDNDGTYTIFSDRTSQESIFYYNDNNFWVVSNSFQLLVDELRTANIPIKINSSALTSFLVGTQGLWGGQLLSCQTLIEDARALDLNEYIVLSRSAQGYSISIHSDAINEEVGNYEEALSKSLSISIRRIEALYRAGSTSVSVDLSGGYDSRMCLGLVLASGIPRSRLSISSSKSKREDYASARNIIEDYGIAESTYTSSTIDGERAFNVWRKGCLGVFLPPYLPGSSSSPTEIRVNGASFRARQYTNLSVDRRLKKLALDLNDCNKYIFKSVYKASFIDAYLDSKSPNALAKHYIHYRSRYLAGLDPFRSYARRLTTPLLSTEMIAASDEAGWEAYRTKQFECDVLTSLDPKLSKFPFDKITKKFSPEELSKSPHINLKDALKECRELDVFGSVNRCTQKRSENCHHTFSEVLHAKFIDALPIVNSSQILPPKTVRSAESEAIRAIGNHATGKSMVITLGELLR